MYSAIASTEQNRRFYLTENANTVEKTDSASSPVEQPSRVGKRSIGGHFDPKVAQAIRILAAEKDITVQVLLAQALNDYLEKNGRKRLADERALPRGAAARAK